MITETIKEQIATLQACLSGNTINGVRLGMPGLTRKEVQGMIRARKNLLSPCYSFQDDTFYHTCFDNPTILGISKCQKCGEIITP